MSTIRLLDNGRWTKPPVIAAARRILTDALVSTCEKEHLGELAEFVNGTSYDAGQVGVTGTPIIRISNITDPSSEFVLTVQEFDPRFMVEPGDLLVSWSASFKTIMWPGPRGILNQHIFRVTEKGKNNRRFIRHLIEAVFDEMQEKVVGIGMMHLRRKAFLEQWVPLPDPEIQKAVAAYLDEIEHGRTIESSLLPAELLSAARSVEKVRQLIDRIENARELVSELANMIPAVVRVGEKLFPEP